MPHQSYIKACQEEGVVPIPYGIPQNKQTLQSVKLDNIVLGDSYAKAISYLLPEIDSKFTLSMSGNRLTQRGANYILDKVNHKVQKMDLSFNPNIKIVDFDKFIINPRITLKSLNIEGNNVGDNFVKKLADAIYQRPIMEWLNLANNMITNKGALALSNLLKDDSV